MKPAPDHSSLISTHDSLDELFALLSESARNGNWRTAHEVGDTFAISLDVHLRHEETVQFPRYAATSPQAAAERDAFLLEHGKIRRAVGALLAAFRQRELDHEAVEQVGALLREHDTNESVHFLPWLERTSKRGWDAVAQLVS